MINALVTGGSGEIGAAICSYLANSGLHVIVHANESKERAESVKQSILESGGSADSVYFDVTDTDTTKTEIERLLASKVIQVLVNNIGLHDDAPMAGMSQDQWHNIINVSLNSFFNVTQPLLLPMMRTRWGRIISISSISGIIGNRGQTNYAAAKSGLHGATRSLALEVATRGITVNAVAPGIIDTDMSKGTFDINRIKEMVPMQRAGTPKEVASLVNYLASKEAAYISGQIISINGAMA
jgi:3-oxoacyl-[acyl-carrier protein] reductase